MAKHTTKTDEGKGNDVTPWTVGDDPVNRAADFLFAASRLIERGRQPDELSKVQRDAMAIVRLISDQFQSAPSVTIVPSLSRCADDIAKDLGWLERRIAAVEQIEQIARSYQSPDWDSTNAQVTRLDALVRPLAEDLAALADVKFEPLIHELDDLAAKLANWSPTPKGNRDGKHGADHILAELIVEANGALGIALQDDATDESEIERVHERLRKDLHKHRTGIKDAK